MTLLRSLVLCILIWDWLADNPTKNKIEAIAELGLERMNNECPCCEYIKVNRPTHSNVCLSCPLFGLWGGKDPNEGCMDPDSYFKKWGRSLTDVQRTINARAIADAGRLKMSKLRMLTLKEKGNKWISV